MITRNAQASDGLVQVLGAELYEAVIRLQIQFVQELNTRQEHDNLCKVQQKARRIRE